MGYERKKLQILGGGFTCLPPVDKVPDTDYLLAQNWRSDALGRLISREGYNGLFSIPGAGIAHSAANMGGVGSPYYVGCNSGITAPTSALYYNANATPIATGFDGGRIGFASQNGFMYVMNRGMQGRHSAAGGWETWTLTPPPASPTVAPGTIPSPVTTVTYTYNLIGDPAYVHSLTIAGVVYSIAENGYSAPQIPLVLSLIAAGDTNCAVTYDGTSQNLVITPIIPNTLILVSGSDGNPDTALGTGGITSLPTGTYQFYLTFQSADLSLESNPGPASEAITVVAQNIAVGIPAADAPVDARIGFVNIYATGGTLGQAYRVGQVVSTVAAPATAFLDTISDLQATNNGIVMPFVNGLPAACKGIIGPYFSRLYAWSPMVQKNRLYFTRPGLPQYWFTDPQVGDWVDVGLEDEEIVWCSIHSNQLVIYKERTIWMMTGTDPTTATLEQVYEGVGLASTFALAPAGAIDYFVGPNGLQLFDMNAVHQISGDILPLFNQQITNDGPRTPPGSVLPGTAFNSTSTDCYAIALGHALGRLYVAYAELAAGTAPLAGTGYGSVVGRTSNQFAWQSGDLFTASMVGSIIVIDGSNFTVTRYDTPTAIELATAAPPSTFAYTCAPTPPTGTGYGIVVGARNLYTWQSGDLFTASMVGSIIVIDGSNFTVTVYDSPTVIELATAAPPVTLPYTLPTPPLTGTGYCIVLGSTRSLYNWQSGDLFNSLMVGGIIVIDGSNFTVRVYDSPTVIELTTAAPPTEVDFTIAAAPQWNLLVYDEGQEPERNAYLATQKGGRWFYHRNDLTTVESTE